MSRAKEYLENNIIGDVKNIDTGKQALIIQAKEIFAAIDELSPNGVCFGFNEDEYNKLKKMYSDG